MYPEPPFVYPQAAMYKKKRSGGNTPTGRAHMTATWPDMNFTYVKFIGLQSQASLGARVQPQAAMYPEPPLVYPQAAMYQKSDRVGIRPQEEPI